MAREMPGYFFFFGGIEATKSILTGGDKSKDGKLRINCDHLIFLNPVLNLVQDERYPLFTKISILSFPRSKSEHYCRCGGRRLPVDNHLSVRRLQIQNSGRKLERADDQSDEADRSHTRRVRTVQRPVAHSHQNDTLHSRPLCYLRVHQRNSNETAQFVKIKRTLIDSQQDE